MAELSKNWPDHDERKPTRIKPLHVRNAYTESLVAQAKGNTKEDAA